MDELGKTALDLLQYLLPGFFTAWIFYALTTYSKPSQFERVVQALIFTLIVQVLLFFIKLFAIPNRYFSWDKNVELVAPAIVAIFLGFVLSYFSNNDKFHKCLRFCGLTKETSYPSEWFGAFLENVTYVVLHLKGERRLYGWPKEWPSDSEEGHFLLQDASWVKDDGQQIPLLGVSSILIAAKDVEFVEFMKKTW